MSSCKEILAVNNRLSHYYRPDAEVFIKPTIAKGVIDHFELEGIKYSPSPTFEFYRTNKEQINKMKKELMMSINK